MLVQVKYPLGDGSLDRVLGLEDIIELFKGAVLGLRNEEEYDGSLDETPDPVIELASVYGSIKRQVHLQKYDVGLPLDVLKGDRETELVDKGTWSR